MKFITRVSKSAFFFFYFLLFPYGYCNLVPIELSVNQFWMMIVLHSLYILLSYYAILRTTLQSLSQCVCIIWSCYSMQLTLLCYFFYMLICIGILIFCFVFSISSGTRIKTRKRNIAAPLDPAAFSDAVVQIYLDNAGDLVIIVGILHPIHLLTICIAYPLSCLKASWNWFSNLCL